MSDSVELRSQSLTIMNPLYQGCTNVPKVFRPQKDDIKPPPYRGPTHFRRQRTNIVATVTSRLGFVHPWSESFYQ